MSALEKIEDGDLIGPNILGDILSDSIENGVEIFSVEASLQDYKIDNFADIRRTKNSEGKLDYTLQLEWPESLKERGKVTREKGRLQDTFLRAGIAKHSNLLSIMGKLRNHDDIIVGLDTNVLLDCTITSVLIDELYAEDFPNWILFVIPKIVMSEIENKANKKIDSSSHPRCGWPAFDGRRGQRALQEILGLDKEDPDRYGLSIMTIGEIEDPDIVKTEDNWWKDSEIRRQFQEFLRNINFHKGTYFLSQDRVNVMMSGPEGAEGLYLQKPDLEDFDSGKISIKKFRKLLYELCIQFGEIRIEGIGGPELKLQLSVFWPGKHVSDWRKSKLKVSNLKATSQS